MAKKEEKKESGAAPEADEFRVPDFDEDQFIHREMVSFRTTSILFVWGIVAALVSWGVFAALDGARAAWFAGLAICAGMGFALKPIYLRLGADIAHFGRREWLGTGFLFFFTWLAVFLIAVNPPLGDYAPPRVDAVVTPAVQQAGSPVTLDIFYADNAGIATHSFRLWRGQPGSETVVAGTDDLERVAGGHYRLRTNASLEAGTYSYEALAEDTDGRAGSSAGSFMVTAGAVRYFGPDADRLDSPLDAVGVQLADGLEACASRKAGKQRMVTGPDGCVRDVRLVRDDGAVHLAWNADKAAWEGAANLAGWKAGNNTFRVEAETADQFEHFTRVPGTNLTLEGPFTVEVAVPVGDTEVKVPLDPAAPVRPVPGPEAGLLVVALVAAAALLRRRPA